MNLNKIFFPYGKVRALIHSILRNETEDEYLVLNKFFFLRGNL